MQKAVIMAGGFGTRLRPLTMEIPKPLVPVLNLPIMEHIVNLLKRHNINDIVSLLYFQPEKITDYFKSTSKPSISSLVLPYTIGVVLDDLAQPPSYSSKSHLALLDELLVRLNKNEIPAKLSTLLTEFPASFQNIINLSRKTGIENNPEQVQSAVAALTKDILSKSFLH